MTFNFGINSITPVVGGGGSGEGGVTDYGALTGKPQINGVVLTGNKTSDDLGLNGEAVEVTASSALAGITVGNNEQISITDTAGNIVITSATGTGSIRFTAGTTAFTLPTGQGWDCNETPTFTSGSIYTVVYDRGTWYADGGRS